MINKEVNADPAFVEWVQSPLIYKENTGFKSQVLSIVPDVYSIESGIYHYRSMAKKNLEVT